MAIMTAPYPAQLTIDYPGQLNRVSTFLRALWAIPILIVFCLLTGAWLAFATALMIAIRVRYPRWWFDFARELTRFNGRVMAYLGLLTDRYPSTVDEQSVHLDVAYPDVDQDLNRWLPLFKWLLAIPHYLVLIPLWIGVVIAVIAAWFAILATGRYPRPLFNYVVGVGRWTLRVSAYAFLLVTDRYPPFSLNEAA